ncbi:glycosyltransferase [Microbacterium phosphatis]|uniref:glycosyltransferase n=1 Tax=Microbacterium phosphatis TaxID=3140248 RepID=UPI0031401BB1
MTVTLRVILDQRPAPARAELSEAALALSAALAETAPDGCDLETVEVSRAKDLTPGGMVHSPTMLAPLVRHDRVTSGDQTVVTLWDLRAWEAPRELPGAIARSERTLLRRAVRHADALIVPTHALAHRLRGIARLDDRVRVIAGAHPAGFATPTDTAARLRDLGLPEGFIALAGGAAPSDALEAGLRAAARTGRDVVVLDVPEGEAAAVAAVAARAGITAERVHTLAPADRGDRAAVLSSAAAFVAPSARGAWPWRVIEAMAIGTPVVAVDSDVHREVVLDGGLVVPAADLEDAVAEAARGDREAERLRVLGRDRSRAFSWTGAAARVWQVHADL